jgi:hypothetical protein
VKEEEIQESAERLAVEMVAEAEEAEAAAEAEAKAEAEAEAAAKAEANTVDQAEPSAAETVVSDEDLLEDGQRKKF